MEIFRAPRVTLIARPEFLEPEHLRVQWRGDSSPGERLAEFAGRICYMSQHNPAHRSTAEYLENIKKQGHGSVLEHAVYVLLIEGISRSCSHELVRHRARLAHDARAAVRRGRGARDPPDGNRMSARVAAGSLRAVLRFRDLRRGRHTGSSARRVSQSLRSDVEKNPYFPIAHPADASYCLLDSELLIPGPHQRPFFVGGHPETTCASVSLTTRNRTPRTPPQSPRVPTTRSPSGTTRPPSLRWSRLSVSSAASSDSKPIKPSRSRSHSPAPISCSTWPRDSGARVAKRWCPRSAST